MAEPTPQEAVPSLSNEDRLIYESFLGGSRADLNGMSREGLNILTQSVAPQEPSTLERIGTGISQAPAATYDWLTSANVEFPELKSGSFPKGTSALDQAKYQALIATTLDDYKLETGIKEIFPDAQTRYDSYGNLLVTLESKDEEGNVVDSSTFYPNPRGLDIPTTFQVATAAGAAPAVEGLLVKTLGQGVTRGYRGAAVVAGTEAGIAEGVSSSLTGLPYDWTAPVGGLVFGPAFLGLGNLLGKGKNYLIQKYSSNPAEVINPDGTLTDDAIAYLKSKGEDPETIQASLFVAFRKLVDDGYIPSEAAIAAQAQGLPVPVNLTRGQLTNDYGLMLWEDAVAKGASDAEATSLLRNFYTAQVNAVRENVEILSSQMGVGPRRRAGIEAQEQLGRQREQARAEANAKYDLARAEQEAFLDPVSADMFAEGIDATLANFARATTPKTWQLVDTFKEGLRKGMSVDEIETFRQQFTSASRDMGSEGEAAAAAREAIDDYLQTYVTNTLYTLTDANGDALTPQAIKLWKDAIDTWKGFKDTWETNGILKELTEQQMRDGELVPKVAPEDAVNQIFGLNFTGLMDKKNINRNVAVLKEQLPEDYWNALRGEVVIKLFDGTLTATSDQALQQVSSTFAKDWATARASNKELIDLLFSREEQGMITQLANVTTRIANRTQNRSNSAPALGQMLGRLSASLNVDIAVKALSPIFASFVRTGKAKASTREGPLTNLTPPRVSPIIIGGASSSALDTENRQLIQRAAEELPIIGTEVAPMLEPTAPPQARALPPAPPTRGVPGLTDPAAAPPAAPTVAQGPSSAEMFQQLFPLG